MRGGFPTEGCPASWSEPCPGTDRQPVCSVGSTVRLQRGRASKWRKFSIRFDASMKSWALQQELPVECGGESANRGRAAAESGDGAKAARSMFARGESMGIIGDPNASDLQNKTRAV